MAKPGRTLDKRQTNRRQKHELDYRAKKHAVTPLSVVLADMVCACSNYSITYVLKMAKAELRRANREAKR